MHVSPQPNSKHELLNFPHRKFYAQLDRKTALTDISHFAATVGGIIICITVYNEPAETFHCSLKAIVENIRFLRQTYCDMPVTICVVVDGIETCSPSMISALERMCGHGKLYDSPTSDMVCHYRSLTINELSELEDVLDPDLSIVSSSLPHSISKPRKLAKESRKNREVNQHVHLLLASKARNHGKLDSHWWFYRVFCPHLVPSLCFQMDVGTIPDQQAFLALVGAFDQDPRTGAAASNILTPVPPNGRDLLQCWQYASFATSFLLEWPAEGSSGYLSVLPGQLSAVRWSAITENLIASPAADVPVTALDVYFKGLGSLTPQESMLYLAEDRVLCSEIVSHPTDEWKIALVDNAMGTTDACQSWGELLRQRKRWNNGYMACRLRYIRRLPAFVGDSAVLTRRKVRASLAGMYHGLLLTHDWFALAICVLFTVALGQNAMSVTHMHPVLHGGLTISLYATLGSLLIQFLLCYRGVLSKQTIQFFRFSMALQIAHVAVALIVNVSLGGAISYALMYVVLYLASPLASLFSHRRWTGSIVRFTPLPLLGYYVVPLLIWMYAVCNVHDSSWGTKGLTAEARSDGADFFRIQAKAGYFRKYRRHYVATWIGSNLALGWIAYYWIRSVQGDAVLWAMGVTSTFMLLGLICRTYIKLKKIFS